MISVIVAIYKKLDYLDLVLKSLEQQSYRDFELIVAEDNNDTSTISFLEDCRKKYFFPIVHVSQADDGFRKTKILNAAVVAAKGDFLIFIDGDGILHKHFLKEYADAAADNIMCYGRRVMLSEGLTKKIFESKNINLLNVFSVFFSRSKWRRAAMYLPFKKNIHKQHREILGSNWGTAKENILAVNGFDEDYVKASVGEDIDLDWRLKKRGLKTFSLKNKAIVYHLYHKPNYNMEDTNWGFELMRNKMNAGEWFCKNGIKK